MIEEIIKANLIRAIAAAREGMVLEIGAILRSGVPTTKL